MSTGPGDDILETLESLPAAEQYTPQAKYEDFRALFMGSDQGRRVLREILAWGRMFKPAAIGTPVDPYAMAMREGERNMALRLLATVHTEPRGRPGKTRTQAENDT